ncbi:MAG: tRNA (adenosine(37)-N6)-dimethylallyltransferase MiaA [Polyangiaceae bacterium]|nr:tRNA (adenosine(37)-N6)-dimethylallyltransferase MiaA [Polyangiaceae bacterium]
MVVGPTASGKTELAILLAQKFGGEIVNADSVQVYTHFDIGSGKPTGEELARAPHHLLSVVDPSVQLEASRYAEMAEQAVSDIRGRNRIPIVCGGSFLWVKALVWGLAPMPGANPAVRAEHTLIAESQGRAALHAQLQLIDPVAAARLSPNDFVRVSRALEVFAVSGKTMTELQSEHGFREQKYKARFIAADRADAELDERIAKRTTHWLQTGWIDEVKHLVDLGYENTRAMQSVGYREVLSYIRGQIPESELAPTIVRATRVFVRRQRTWIRDLPIHYVKI